MLRYLLSLSLFPLIVGAQNSPPGIITSSFCGGLFITGKLRADCIPIFIAHIIQIIIGFIGAMLLIHIIIAGYQIAVANVIDDKASGKNRLIWSMVGFAVCV